MYVQWLSAPNSDGRCPTCRVPCSIEEDTICLHSPERVMSLKTTHRSNKRRLFTVAPLRRSGAQSRALPDSRSSSPESLSSSGSTSTNDSSASSSDNEGSDEFALRVRPSEHRGHVALLTRQSPSPLLDSFFEHGFGRLISFLGCVLVISALCL